MPTARITASCAARTRQGRRFAARCARPWRAVLASPAGGRTASQEPPRLAPRPPCKPAVVPSAVRGVSVDPVDRSLSTAVHRSPEGKNALYGGGSTGSADPSRPRAHSAPKSREVASHAGSRALRRRGRDSNPRWTERPTTVSSKPRMSRQPSCRAKRVDEGKPEGKVRRPHAPAASSFARSARNRSSRSRARSSSPGSVCV
jgi:hypothetical protein